MPDKDDDKPDASDNKPESPSEDNPDIDAEYPSLGYQTEGYEPKRREHREKGKK